ncbi:MAG: CRISPR-associated endonuclease Cas1 [Lachnospiraceae bacterium]|nr:CRISPR-associated endonuclease Cas1 [Lachnospiraceae bacterium]
MNITLETVLSGENVREAMKKLREKPDVAGLDGVRLSEMPEYWETNGERIREELLSGSYKPGLISRREIVAGNGKRRRVVMINAVDRLLQRMLYQVLEPVVDSVLSEHCYAFRTGRGTLDAAKKAASCMESGKTWVAEIDIKSFFDSIPIDVLLDKLKVLVTDEIVMRLIRSLLTATTDDYGEVSRVEHGLLQGAALSPVFANLYLNAFDQALSDEGLSFYRYGDDINIYCETYEEAIRVRRLAEEKLNEEGLTVHPGKGGVFLGKTRQCLGFEFSEKAGKIYISRSVKQKRDVYHHWQKSAVRKAGKRYHLVSGGVLSRKDFTLLFENEDGKRFLPVEAIEQLNIYSDVTFTSGFFEYANRMGLRISLVDKSGEPVGSFVPFAARGSYETEAAQLLLLKNEPDRLKLAKRYQNANIFNLRAVLRYYDRRGDDSEIAETIAFMTELLKKVNEAKQADVLMIYEAQARQRYYRCFNRIMSDSDFTFVSRNRRPPKDPLNAMISFGNTLLYHLTANEIRMTSLDIRFGILHNSRKRTESLNLDVADLFKPVIVDRTIFTLVNRKIISPFADFREVENGGIYLSEKGRRKFIREYENKLSQKIRVGKTTKTYQDLIRDEIHKIEQFFRNGAIYKPYKYVN